MRGWLPDRFDRLQDIHTSRQYHVAASLVTSRVSDLRSGACDLFSLLPLLDLFISIARQCSRYPLNHSDFAGNRLGYSARLQ